MNVVNRYALKPILGSILVAAIAFIVAPTLVMWAWNLALPEVFSVASLTFRNALGLVLLGLVSYYLLSHPLFSRQYRHPHRSRREEG